MGLRQALGYLPSDNTDGKLDPAWVIVENYLRRRYINNDGENARRKEAALRRELYCDGGVQIVQRLIDSVFADPAVREARKLFAPFANYDNALKRIVNLLARVYAKPAVRRAVANPESDRRYQELQRQTKHDQRWRTANRLMHLSNDVFVGFRVRTGPLAAYTDGGLVDNASARQPVIDVVGQDDLYAVCHPRDPLHLVAIVIDQFPSGEAKTYEPQLDVRVVDADAKPHYVVWTDDEVFKLDRSGHIIPETLRVNPFGVIPGVLVHREEPDRALLDPYSGGDLVSARVASWLEATMMLKESKALTKQNIFYGDGVERMPSGQSMDSDVDLIAPDGVGVTQVDRGVDLDAYRTAADHIVERAAANAGIPPTVLRHDGASSGYEIDLRRIELEERREDDILILRPAEREFARIQSIVLAHDMPELAFDPAGWFVDYAEVKRPLSEREKYEVREIKRRLGHSDVVLEVREDNPDFTVEQAETWVADRVATQVAFLHDVRAHANVPADVNTENPGQSPALNGAEGGKLKSLDN